jgi:hypothetical protein
MSTRHIYSILGDPSFVDKIKNSNWESAIADLKGNKSKKSSNSWSPEEDEALMKAIEIHKEKNWKLIAAQIEGRTPAQCMHRWKKVLNPSLVKGAWTKEEDAILIRLVQQNGPQNWTEIANQLNGRNGKQCRER